MPEARLGGNCNIPAIKQSNGSVNSEQRGYEG